MHVCILMYNTEGMIIYFIPGISYIPITKWDAKSMNMCMAVALNPTRTLQSTVVHYKDLVAD